MKSEEIILCERNIKRLITCTLKGETIRNLDVNGYPCYISVIDDSNVAVSLQTRDGMFFEIVMVDVHKLNVIRSIGRFLCNIKILQSEKCCCPLTFANDELFVHASTGKIVSMDISDNERTKIDLSDKSISFTDLSYNKLSNDIYGMSFSGESIISVKNDGSCSTFQKFTDTLLVDRQLAIDNDGNVLVFTSKRYNSDYVVHSISPDGKSQKELFYAKIDQLQHLQPGSQHYAGFCMQNSLRIIVIVKSNGVHVYKYRKGS